MALKNKSAGREVGRQVGTTWMRKLTVRDMLAVQGAFNSWECVAPSTERKKAREWRFRRVQRAIGNVGDDPADRASLIRASYTRRRGRELPLLPQLHRISGTNKNSIRISYSEKLRRAQSAGRVATGLIGYGESGRASLSLAKLELAKFG